MAPATKTSRGISESESQKKLPETLKKKVSRNLSLRIFGSISAFPQCCLHSQITLTTPPQPQL